MQLDRNDLNMIVRRMPKKLLDTMKSEKWHGKIFLGGGFIRGVIACEKINDVDLFLSDKLDCGILGGELAERPTDLHKTDNALTIKARVPIQIITRWLFDKPEDVAMSFDFTVCCAVIWFDGKKWLSYCDDRFYIDLASKRLVYRVPERNEDAGGSMLRVLKYYQRGYRIPLDSLASVIARLMKDVDLTLIRNGLKDEAQVSKCVTGLLREVDPNIDVNHDSHLPSNIE